MKMEHLALAGEPSFLRYRGKITDDDHPKDKQVTINSFKNVDLEGWTLVAIPIAVHKNAEKVVSLKLSGNPMLEIPLDFVQSCTSLLDLRLSNMSLKSVPKSVRHALPPPAARLLLQPPLHVLGSLPLSERPAADAVFAE
ncbi:hypothetical protein H0H87_009374 [Tephrocybe sp. NHM501043]|nr:hypothetical protein H0H87_009374 [Tephrocybe sp. NHM501043]